MGDESGAELAVELIETIFARCPALRHVEPVTLIAAMIQVFAPPNVPSRVIELFAFDCARAIDCIRRERAARWKN
jgi:hypothetical protein